MKLQIAKWGNSAAIRLPKAVLELLDVQPGSELEVTIEGRTMKLVAARGGNRFPTLEELVAEMKRVGPDGQPRTVDWGPDVGSEIIEDDGDASGRAKS
jgi:antitoxin MazE